MMLRLEGSAGEDFEDAAREALNTAIVLQLTVFFEANGVNVMISKDCAIFPQRIAQLIREAIEKGKKVVSL